MILERNEYLIKSIGDLETITITKKAIEEWRDHYNGIANDTKDEPWHFGFYLGKADLLTEILKHFKEED